GLRPSKSRRSEPEEALLLVRRLSRASFWIADGFDNLLPSRRYVGKRRRRRRRFRRTRREASGNHAAPPRRCNAESGRGHQQRFVQSGAAETPTQGNRARRKEDSGIHKRKDPQNCLSAFQGF